MSSSKKKFKLSVPDEEFSRGDDDFRIETVGKILDGYQVSAYNKKQEQVKIMQDQTPRHYSFRKRQHEKESPVTSSVEITKEILIVETKIYQNQKRTACHQIRKRL